MQRFFGCALAAVALVVLLAPYSADGAGVATLAIDFGSEWIKMGLVKPGVPMDIVLNRESKRKTANLVAIRKGERTFGLEALHVAVKYPQNGFRYLSLLLGMSVNSAAAEKYASMFPEHKLEAHPTRDTVVFRIDEETAYTVEELVAMILQHVVELGSEYAEQLVTSVVLSVPPYYNQAARRALMTACEIAEINVMRFIGSPSSISLNYGVFRRKEFTPEERHIVFYDMGSSATKAAVATFFTAKDKESKMKVPHVEIRGLGFDESLGAFDWDLILRDYLLQQFKENYASKIKGDPAKNPRTMAKLLKDAQRIKTVLSANTETNAQIEGLFEEIDFRCKVTRETMETLAKDLYPRVAQPLFTAVAKAGLEMKDIETVIIVGGGVRMPKVQEILKAANEDRELGKGLNGDEANALGAAFEAASLSKAFRVKKFISRDYNPYPIEVHYDRVPDEEEEDQEVRRVVREVFPQGNPMPKRKEVVFKRFSDDFSFDVNYGHIDVENPAKTFGSLNLTSVDVSGVAAALNKHENGTNKVIKAVMELDKSGILNVTRVYANYEVPAPPAPPSPSIMDTISNFFSDDKKAKEGDEAAADDSNEEREEADTESSQEDEESSASEETETSSEEAETSSEKAAPEGEEPEAPKAEEGEPPSTENDEGDAKEGDAKEGENVADGEDAAGTAGNSTESAAEAEARKAAEAAAAKKVEEDSKPRPVKITLDITTATKDLPDMDEDTVSASRERLRTLLEKERKQKEREMAFNRLEAFIFDVQEKLGSDDVEKVSTEEQREELGTQLREASDWMYEDGFQESTEVFIEKTNDLNKTAKAIFYRAREMNERPAAIERLRQSLNLTRTFVAHVRNQTANATEDEPAWITAAELDTLELLCNDTQEWLEEKIKAQAELPLTESPVLKTSAVSNKASKLDQQTISLARKPKPKPKKKEPKADAEEGTADDAKAGANATESDADAESATPEGAEPLEEPTPAAAEEGDQTAGDADPTGTVDEEADDDEEDQEKRDEL